MKIKLFLFNLLICSAFILNAQSVKYDIVLFGKTIGNGSALSSTATTGNRVYKLTTKASATVLFKDHTSYTDIDIQYKGDVLQSCKLKREKDGEWQDIVVSYENGKHYYSNGGAKQVVSKPITYTSTLFFFKEPKGISEVYIERLNIFAPVEKVEEGLYKTVIEGGDNYYRYENGEMVEFRLKKGVNIYMNRL